ncbi:rho GTPase-activating protein 20-like [Heliangelus exortis]|uniref:rho GTPase-activating protein 20-like n=1 Tax=Heliangelus exortis TaxID=472823 RepID=UPI003A921500
MEELIVHRECKQGSDIKQGKERRGSTQCISGVKPLNVRALLSRWGPSGDTPGNGHSACRERVVQAGSSTGESHALAQRLSVASQPPWQPRLGHWALPSAHQCVPGEAFPDTFRMGQLNCTHGSRSKRERVPIRSLEVLLRQRVRVTWGRETRERDLFLLSDVLIIAKPKRGGAPRPKLVLALDQLQVLCGSTGAAGDGAQEEEGKNSNSLVLTWSHGSCIVTFPSWALKELWVSAFLGIPEEGEGPKVTQLPSINLLLKVLHGLNAEKTLNTSRLERLLEEQAKAGAEQQPPPIPSGSEGEDGHAAAGRTRRRRWGLPRLFGRRGTSAAAEAPKGPGGSGSSAALFGQPLAALCSQDGTLPQPIQDLLALLHQQGPSTKGIFRLAAEKRACRQLRKALESGAEVPLGSHPVHLLAAILKDFLREIPSKLLEEELYEEWMRALQKTSRQEGLAALKEVASKLPEANLQLFRTMRTPPT